MNYTMETMLVAAARQKPPRKLSKIACAFLLSGSLLAEPAHAVDPDNGEILSGFWTTANLIKEYFDWRGWAAWGSIGALNVIITSATGASDGAFTKAVFTSLCGATAAGFVAAWKPATGPGAATHIKAIVKAGSVTAVSSACGWATHAILSKIDSEIPAAQKAIDKAKKEDEKNYNEIVDDKTRVNNAFLGIEMNHRDAARAVTSAGKLLRQYQSNGCEPTTPSTLCTDLYRRWAQALAEAQKKVDTLNEDGRAMTVGVQDLDTDVKS
ncbi:hypothetical protein ACC713_35560 [Rhizobium johnstonii]|uniref:hypothetical protein n=1 Tax=Rhizobium TaxID=379 RepID=UPI001FE239CD|nr:MULTISPECIES: hypothetical protein [Rhizobium]